MKYSVASAYRRLFVHATLFMVISNGATSACAHADPASHDDHMRLLEEVTPREQATYIAVRNGTWSDPAVWGGKIPDSLARILIPPGITVIYNTDSANALGWILIEGTLRFDPDSDTQLKVETIVVDSAGMLEIGTPATPISSDKHAVIEFTDPGPIADWSQLGRGLITLGGISVWGAETTSFIALKHNPRVGDKALELSETPRNWAVGGVVVVPGVRPPATPDKKDLLTDDVDPLFREQHEVRTISAINGNTLTLSSKLIYDLHYQLPVGRTIPVAYLSRNIVFRSENRQDPSRRGHIMVMLGENLNRAFGYALLDGLGRTHTEAHVTDPQLDANGDPIPETLANPRGRYSLHFHKNGPDPATRVLVKGIAVNDGLKWGVVNHGSNVDVEDCVSFKVRGAHFATENGVEVGSFKRNLAICSLGYGKHDRSPNRKLGSSGQDLLVAHNEELQKRIAPIGKDWGFAGYGFWLQGALVPVTENQSYGAMREGVSFSLEAVGTDYLGEPARVPLAELSLELQQALALDKHGQPESSVAVQEVPFQALENISVGAGAGLGSYFTIPGSRKISGSLFQGGLVANSSIGVNIYPPSVGQILDGIEIAIDPGIMTANIEDNSGTVFYSDVSDMTFKDLRISNYSIGISIPPSGHNLVTGSKTLLRNRTNISISDNGGRENLNVIELGDSNFAAMDDAALSKLHGKTAAAEKIAQHNIVLKTDFDTPDELLKPRNRQIVWARPGEPRLHVYFLESARDYRLDSEPRIAKALTSILPERLVHETSLQLWEAQRSAIHGVLAPADAHTIPGLNGVASTELGIQASN
jgi:hypothetical protein